MTRAALIRACLFSAGLLAATLAACGSGGGASSPGCTTDDECKGARRCRGGSCVDPGGGAAGGGGGGSGGGGACSAGRVPVVRLEGVPREGASEVIVRARVFSSGPIGSGSLPAEAAGATHFVELHDQQPETLVVSRLYYSVEHEECAAQLTVGQPVKLSYVTWAPSGASTGVTIRDELRGSLLFAAEAGGFGGLHTGEPELVLTPEQVACSYQEECGSWSLHDLSVKIAGLQGPQLGRGELALLDLGAEGVAFLELDEWRSRPAPSTCTDQADQVTGYVFSRASGPGG